MSERKLPPLLSEHSRPVQVVLAGVVPALYGALAGVFLGVSEPVYLVLAVLGILGAVVAGFDHIGARAGALRGVVAGSVFGSSILIAHEIHGAEAEAHLPEPAIVLVLVTTGIAIPLAALGGRLRERQDRKATVREGPEVAVEEAARAIEIPPSPRITPAEPTSQPPEPAGHEAEAREAKAPEGEASDTPTPEAAAPTPEAAAGALDLNKATFEELRQIGLSITQTRRVLAHRERSGGYTSIDEIESIPGFPKEFVAKLKTKLTVG